jgi:hypothetical protein
MGEGCHPYARVTVFKISAPYKTEEATRILPIALTRKPGMGIRGQEESG